MYQGYKELKTAEDGSASKESNTPTKLYHFCSAAIRQRKNKAGIDGSWWMLDDSIRSKV